MGVATDLATAKTNLDKLKEHVKKMEITQAKDLLKKIETNLATTMKGHEEKKQAAAAGLTKLNATAAVVAAVMNETYFQEAKALAALSQATAAASAVVVKARGNA